MNKILKLTLPLPPSVNSYQRYRVKRVGKRLRVEAYPSKETEDFYESSVPYVREEMKKQQWKQPLKGKYVVVECIFYLTKKGADADNFFKCSLDCLEKAGVVINDSFFIPQTIDVLIDKDDPRIELEVYESEKNGIFANEEEMENFIRNNCDKCRRRNKNKCIVFKGFKENRCHALDENGNCKEFKGED